MMNLTRRRLVATGGTALGLVLASCSDILPGRGPAPDLYTLTPKTTFDQKLPSVTWQLVVEEPSATRGLDTDQIALTPSALEIKYYKGARWIDRAPRLIQVLLVRSFEHTNKIVSVGKQAIGLRSDFNLVTELREFQADYSTAGEAEGTSQMQGAPEGAPSTRPVIRVTLSVKIVKQPKQTIVASRTIEVALQARGTDMRAIVAAFDDALGKALKQVVEWTMVAANANISAA